MPGFISDCEKADAVEVRTGCWPGHFVTSDLRRALWLGKCDGAQPSHFGLSVGRAARAQFPEQQQSEIQSFNVQLDLNS